MTKSLRKRHRQVWMLLALALPAGILLSWLAIPNQSPVQLLQADGTIALPVIEHTIDKPAYTLRLRTDTQHTATQLEWINKQALTVPSAVIYQLPDSVFNKATAKLIGRIEARGKYLFPLDIQNNQHTKIHFVLYDFIHEQIIEHFNVIP